MTSPAPLRSTAPSQPTDGSAQAAAEHLLSLHPHAWRQLALGAGTDPTLLGVIAATGVRAAHAAMGNEGLPRWAAVSLLEGRLPEPDGVAPHTLRQLRAVAADDVVHSPLQLRARAAAHPALTPEDQVRVLDRGEPTMQNALLGAPRLEARVLQAVWRRGRDVSVLRRLLERRDLPLDVLATAVADVVAAFESPEGQRWRVGRMHQAVRQGRAARAAGGGAFEDLEMMGVETGSTVWRGEPGTAVLVGAAVAATASPLPPALLASLLAVRWPSLDATTAGGPASDSSWTAVPPRTPDGEPGPLWAELARRTDAPPEALRRMTTSLAHGTLTRSGLHALWELAVRSDLGPAQWATPAELLQLAGLLDRPEAEGVHREVTRTGLIERLARPWAQWPRELQAWALGAPEREARVAALARAGTTSLTTPGSGEQGTRADGGDEEQLPLPRGAGRRP